jgi:hypothetical protein
MTSQRNWAAGAVATGLVAVAGLPSSAAGEATLPLPTPDAITQCLAKAGFPPLPAGAILVPASAGAPALPATGVPPTTGVPAPAVPALPIAPAAPTAPPTAATPPTAPAPAPDAGAALQCGQMIINNTVYMMVVTVTTTTTTVDGPISVVGGSISNGVDSGAAAPGAVPVGGASAAPGTGSSGIGRPLRVTSSPRPAVRRSRHRGRPARVVRVVRVKLIPTKRVSRH